MSICVAGINKSCHKSECERFDFITYMKRSNRDNPPSEVSFNMGK